MPAAVPQMMKLQVNNFMFTVAYDNDDDDDYDDDDGDGSAGLPTLPIFAEASRF